MFEHPYLVLSSGCDEGQNSNGGTKHPYRVYWKMHAYREPGCHLVLHRLVGAHRSLCAGGFLRSDAGNGIQDGVERLDTIPVIHRYQWDLYLLLAFDSLRLLIVDFF